MFSSLRARLWLSYALIILTALSVVAIVLFVYLLRNPFLYRQTLERLKAVETVVLSHEAASSDRPLTFEKAAQTFNVRLVLYSADRQILLDSDSDSSPSLSFPKKNIITRKTPILRDSNGRAWIYSLTHLPDQTWLLVAAPRPRFSVLAVFSDELLPMFIQGGLIALLLSLILAFLIARWVADPLQQVVAAAGSVPSDAARLVELRGPREIQELTRAFNAMVSRVQSSQTSQRDFVANVSHELKTPLTSIQGFAQAILDGTADSPQARNQAAQVIYAEAGRMHRMVVDLLDLARLDSGTADLTMSPLDVKALLNAVVEKFAPLAEKAGVTLKLDLVEEIPALMGDGDRLAQVFINLVDNALKYTPRGGAVTLRARVEKAELIASVSDTGVGISPEALPHVFDRFYQGDPSREGGEKHGAGLGLAIVKEIVQAHGGRITVRSQAGEGTIFTLSLPLTGPAIITRVSGKK